MNCGRQWQDVCILNYSAHGIGLACDDPPPRGSYLEIRRGPFVIIACVAWSKGHRFGARTQDPIADVAIVGRVTTPIPIAGKSPLDRRSASRPVRPAQPTAETSRQWGRSLELTAAAFAALACAVTAGQMVRDTLAAPLEATRAALAVNVR